MARSVRDVSPVDLSTYPALNFEGLELRANYRLISFREDVLHVLDQKEAAAIIVQILLRWHEYLRDNLLETIEQRSRQGLLPFAPDEIEDRLWVYMSYARFVRESGGALGYNTVIRTLEYLVETKQVVERRVNQNPNTVDYADYEYRVNRTALRDLLKALPASPQRSSKKGKLAQDTTAEEASASSGEAPSTQTGTPCDDEPGDVFPSPQMGTPSQVGLSSAHMGRPSPHLGTPPTHEGTEDYPNGQTIQRILQDSPQKLLQQQQQGASDLASDPQVPAPAVSAFESLPPDEIALVVAHCSRKQQEGAEGRLVRAELVAASLPKGVYAPAASATFPPDEPSALLDALATPEALVALVERKLDRHFDAQERALELAAARFLLTLLWSHRLSMFERVYDAGNDVWWKQHHGELYLRHLVEREKNGTIRFVRWLARQEALSHASARPAPPEPSFASPASPLAVRIPLRSGGGLTLAQARALREEIACDRRLDLRCTVIIVQLSDHTYAVLADRTITETVRQVAFYSVAEWRERSATFATVQAFFGLKGQPVNIAALVAQMRTQARKGVRA